MRIVAVAAGLVVAAVASLFQAQQPPASSRAEEAYRQNNAGVASLERFDYAAAAERFRKALEIDPSIHIARLNLAIAAHYGGDAATAQREALAVAKALPKEPRAWFIAGLAARAAGEDAAALSAFERVVEIDPADAGALTNLGQLYMEAGRHADAIARLNAAVAAEPFNATASYNLARALLQGGRAAEGQEAMKRFQSLREAPYAVTYSNGYLQQGAYGEALVSTGTEPQLVDPATPAVRFTDASAALPQGLDGVQAIALADVDGDRDFDVVAAGASGVRLLLRDGSSWKPSSAISAPAAATGAIVADYDNDSRADLLAIRDGGVTLWRQQDSGAFEDVTSRAALGEARGGRTGAFVDIDHDGDVDVVSAGAAVKGLDAWRNNGNGTFARFDASTGLTAAPAGAAAVVATDFDNRRDVDLLIAGSGGLALLKNLRDGRFEEAAAKVGLPSGAFTVLAAGDLNGDQRTDFFAGRTGGAGVWLLSDGASRYRVEDAPPQTRDTAAAQLLDYDADGVVDLVTLGATGLRVFRRTATAWTDASGAAGTSDKPCGSPCAMASADLDEDGDIDLVTVESGRLRTWRNESPARPSLTVALKAHVSNRSAVGARLELRAGSLLRRLETSISTPSAVPAGVVFGLGARERADVVRVTWPSGIVQAEQPEASAPRAHRMEITELDRKPSSCPYLFTWNGTRFEFVTDFLGGGEIGYWLAPGVRNVPDPEEYVRIRRDQLVARDGRLELRVTNELEETLFLDELSLVSVVHPEGTEVYPHEGLFAPPYPAHRLSVIGASEVPRRVVDEHGHDVRPLVETVDRRAPSDFTLERLRGYAGEHYIAFDVPARAVPGLRLLLTAWTDYAFSSDNVAAHQAGLSLRPPSLELLEPGGEWRTVVDNIGIPVGRPQTIVVDAAGKLPHRALTLRVRTNMRIYWDQVLLAASKDVAVKRQPLAVRAADLRWRGYSAEVSPDGRPPFGYDYARVLFSAPWKLLPGRYTREGDVRELLARTDDRFVVSRPGDEVALAFEAPPAPPAGWTRTFLLHADGFSKEMDPNSASPDVAAPLPFHGMRNYPHDAAARTLTAAQRADVERYHTRIVARPVPVLVAPVDVGTK